MSFTAIDIFAGGGGLTVGLKRAGFSVISAIELDSYAYSTFKSNHPEVVAFHQDVRTVKSTDIAAIIPDNHLDLLAGCPPCQGFSSLTAKYKRNDPRNSLIFEMLRLIRELRPTAVMMENVPGLTTRGNSLLNEFLSELIKLGYLTSHEVLQVANYGVPQSRRRFVLLAGYNFNISIPKPTHSEKGVEGLPRWKTVRETIQGLPSPIILSDALKEGGPQKYGWHVVRTLSEINYKRLSAAKPGKSRQSIPEDLRPSCHKGKSKGFGNVYGRLAWDKPSVTITGGCTTLSKGRFGHPEELRTISVKEAALLQTFPDDYYFDVPYMEPVCDIIGNALPCDFAAVLASAVRCALEDRSVKSA